MGFFKSILVGIAMYSRLPVPQIEWTRENMRFSMCALPLIGAVIGLLLWGWHSLAELLDIDKVLFGAVYGLIPIAVTGGIHMDGLMDTADALGSRGDINRKLSILKDSHTGAFGVLACVIYMILYVSFGAAADWQRETMLILGAGMVFQRCLSGIAVTAFPCAKDSGLLYAFADSAAKITVRTVLAILAIGAMSLMIALEPWQSGAMILAAILSFFYYYWMSKRQFGGITGDLAGYFLQICELVMLGALVLAQKILEVI